MPTYFITGANRGLGLEFVRQLAEKDNTILACTRSPSSSEDLSAHASKSKNIHILECDVSSLSSIESLHSKVSEAIGSSGQIDYLLNNSGINAAPHETSLSISPEEMHTHIDVNVIGPAKVVETLQPFLKKGSVVMNMTSGLGSCGKTISDIKEGKCTTYSISKAAVDMLTVHQAFHLKDQGVRVVCMDPGWVKTRMGGEGAILEPEVSISGMLKAIHGLGEKDTAQFYTYTGEQVPW